MIPIADESPKGFIPFVNYVFIALNILVFFFLQPSGMEAASQFYKTYGLIPRQLITEPSNLDGYMRIFTSMFLHGGLGHLFGNMLYLWIFGDNIEYVLGHKFYILFYFMVGIGAALLQISTNPQSTIPMVGASGAISGILGAYLLKFPKNRVTILFFIFFIIRIIRVPALIVLSLWFLMQIFRGYFTVADGGAGGGVAWFAHIGGFLSGFLLIKIFEYFAPPKRKKAIRRNTDSFFNL
ncbi:MAG: rhomboid family intramembrane serine protease [Caldithrix sp.]|nr:rhomboid family intramembrane serine protease [Caldithrix sp.]